MRARAVASLPRTPVPAPDPAAGPARRVPVAVLSGGSEISAVALTEELLEDGFTPVVISLGGESLLRGIPSVPFFEIPWPPADPEEAARAVGDLLRRQGAETRIPLLPTEDGGLRLVLEHRSLLEPWCVFSAARALRMGGLDKAELFSFLEASGLEHRVAPTRVATSRDEALAACSEFGGDAVLKPALKPLSMELRGMTAKTLATRAFRNRSEMERAIQDAWPVCGTWVVQPRLRPTATGSEPVVWAVRDARGRTWCAGAEDLWMYPKDGGTACWVRVLPGEPHPGLFAVTREILDATDFVGTCELSFLFDECGIPRLVELNPRPWLQVGLARRSGFPLARATVASLLGRGLAGEPNSIRSASWVNLERLLLAALSGEHGPRLRALRAAWRAVRSAEAVAVYDSRLPKVRWRWLRRTLRKSRSFLP